MVLLFITKQIKIFRILLKFLILDFLRRKWILVKSAWVFKESACQSSEILITLLMAVLQHQGLTSVVSPNLAGGLTLIMNAKKSVIHSPNQDSTRFQHWLVLVTGVVISTKHWFYFLIVVISTNHWLYFLTVVILISLRLDFRRNVLPYLMLILSTAPVWALYTALLHHFSQLLAVFRLLGHTLLWNHISLDGSPSVCPIYFRIGKSFLLPLCGLVNYSTSWLFCW